MNLPLIFKNKNILLMGIGGGQDILGTLPLYAAINKQDETNNVFLASHNTTESFQTAMPGSEVSPDKEVQAIMPELDMTSFPKVGVRPLVDMINKLIDEKKIDVIIGVDGGVDSLMHGDEKNSGTVLEDFVALIAISQTKIKDSYLACLGFGTETEEDLNHYRVLENMAQLADDFIGCCAITQSDKEFYLYRKVCETAWSKLRKSHIHTKVISAVLGNFDSNNAYTGSDAALAYNSGNKSFINPLMSLYWFYDLRAVVKRNMLVSYLSNTNTKTDTLMAYRQFLNSAPAMRDKRHLPI